MAPPAKDGEYRWFLVQYHPLRDEQGQILRWYASGTDIDDRKRAEERMRNENLALREESTGRRCSRRSSARPGPAARPGASVEGRQDRCHRAHPGRDRDRQGVDRPRHSQALPRATRAFIRVNCAAIPPSLIASELFGHEKGAFTGALQRRLGRFEAAQAARSSWMKSASCPSRRRSRCCACSRSGRSSAWAAASPFGRCAHPGRHEPRPRGGRRERHLSRGPVLPPECLPIRIPPLRERAGDIPILVEYLVERYAKQTGKRIRGIEKQTLQRLQAYDWPGNVRELQNVIERAVVLSEGETFSIDASWLKGKPHEASKRMPRPVTTLAEGEKALIEAALTETHGRIAGPAGAAAKLGLPRQTLESKIKALNIDKLSFRMR